MDEERDECCNDSNCCDNTGLDDSLLVGNGEGINFSSGATITYNTTTTGLYYSNDPKPKTKMKDIIIKEMDYGYLVKIGCQTFCVETHKKLLKALKKYMKDPVGVEELHTQGEFMENLD